MPQVCIGAVSLVFDTYCHIILLKICCTPKKNCVKVHLKVHFFSVYALTQSQNIFFKKRHRTLFCIYIEYDSSKILR